MNQLFQIVNSMHTWLKADENNIAVTTFHYVLFCLDYFLHRRLYIVKEEKEGQEQSFHVICFLVECFVISLRLRNTLR